MRQGCPLSPILFSLFINDLVEELRQVEGQVLVGVRKLFSLLYADDIVLMCDSPAELQEMITIVDRFCAKWRLSLNTDKSKVMIVTPPRTNLVSEENEEALDETPRWLFRGQELEIVTKYKYLGVWFTNNLSWTAHVSYIRDKARRKLYPLRCVFAQREVPLVIKRLIHTSLIRSQLEYASPVWYTSETQTDTLEAIQHTACTWLLRTNQKASRVALRAILGLPSLAIRRDMLRLFYLTTIFSKSELTLVRHCFEIPPDTNSKVAGKSQQHWYTIFNKLRQSSPTLKAAYSTLLACLRENDGVLTSANEDAIIEWRNNVRAFAHEKAYAEFKLHQNRSTLRILQEIYPPSFGRPLRLIRRTSSHSNWRRIRLLCGTSALRDTLSRIRPGTISAICPVCRTEVENAAHFLLQCTAPSMIQARSAYFARAMTLPFQGLFFGLSPEARSAVILGCTVPCAAAEPNHWLCTSSRGDLYSETYVASIWQLRCDALDRDTQVVDLSNVSADDAAAPEGIERIESDSEPESSSDDWSSDSDSLISRRAESSGNGVSASNDRRVITEEADRPESDSEFEWISDTHSDPEEDKWPDEEPMGSSSYVMYNGRPNKGVEAHGRMATLST